MNNSNLPIFQYSTGYAGKFAGVVGDDDQAVGVVWAIAAMCKSWKPTGLLGQARVAQILL